MAENQTTKILRRHLPADDFRPGEEVGLRVDEALLQDATGTMACLQLEELGVDEVSVPLAVQYVDHNLIQLDFRNPDDHRFLQDFSARYGIVYSRPGNGICHYLHVERFARPGDVIVGADSHTTTSGAVGAIAVGAGGLDVAACMSGQPLILEAPRVVGVELRGCLPEWVQAKDIILELLRRRSVRGGVGRIFEFHGDGVPELNVGQRMTICNMIAELGATTGVFPSDERTREWMVLQKRQGDWQPLTPDEGASYDEDEVIDLSSLEPLIARPHSPDHVVPVREVVGLRAAQVCVGSSVNSGYDDLAIVAAVLKGKTIAPNLVMTVTPGSRQILDIIARSGVFTDLIGAGARMLEAACGPCVGMGQAPASGTVSLRTFNRNFPGRSGTQDDNVFLCSPTTAAATALRGVITDPRELGPEPSLPPSMANPEIDDSQILWPPPKEDRRAVVISRGPNIKPPPPQAPLPDALQGDVLIVTGDDVSTGDLAPDGAVVMALRSNVDAMSSFTFRRLDPTFATRARDAGGGFIVAGWNYGQGSSREHAALAPKALGVRAVFARSFARIHRGNLIAQGIVPLTLEGTDYEAAQQGQAWRMPRVRQELASGSGTVDMQAGSRSFRARVNLSVREREVLLAGGLLAYLKAGGKPLSAGKAMSGVVDQGSPITQPAPGDEQDS
ncbi:MAG: aconitate hydratase [Chloroflexi bacterium]|nr:aconitate hydratase [Chloroflexota bacterium]